MTKVSAFTEDTSKLAADEIGIVTGTTNRKMTFANLFKNTNGSLLVASNDANVDFKAVADYICDGTADDVQIQAAINALTSVGGTVILSEGNFNIAAKITIKSKCRLVGHGIDITIIKQTANSTISFENSDTAGGNTDIELLDFTLNADNTTLTGTANSIMMDKVNDCLIQRVKVHDSTNDAITARNGTNATIKDCIVTDYFLRGICLLSSNHDSVIINCFVDGGTTRTNRAIHVQSSNRCIVSGCRVTNFLVAGIQLDTSNHSIITGCLAYTGEASGLGIDLNCTFCSITDSISNDNGLTTADQGIIVNGVDSVVSGCIAEGNTGAGIDFGGAARSVCSGNRVTGNATIGIEINGATGTRSCDDCIVIGNVINANTLEGIRIHADDAGTPLFARNNIIVNNRSFNNTREGIEILVRGNTNFIINNYLSGNGVAQLADGGSANVIGPNEGGFTSSPYTISVADDTANAGIKVANSDGSIQLINVSSVANEFHPGINGLSKGNTARGLDFRAFIPVANDTGSTPCMRFLVLQEDSTVIETRPTFLFSNLNTDQLRIDALNNIVFGPLSALATTAIDGFIYIPTMAGAPTGNSTDYTGKIPLVWDSTNNKLWVNTTGTTWLGVVLA